MKDLNKFELLILKDTIAERLQRLTKDRKTYEQNKTLFTELKKIYLKLEDKTLCNWCEHEEINPKIAGNFCSSRCRFDFYGE